MVIDKILQYWGHCLLPCNIIEQGILLLNDKLGLVISWAILVDLHLLQDTYKKRLSQLAIDALFWFLQMSQFLFLFSDCKCVNGLCSEGVDGDGRCYCQHGWKGQICNTCKYHHKVYKERYSDGYDMILSVSLIDQYS